MALCLPTRVFAAVPGGRIKSREQVPSHTVLSSCVQPHFHHPSHLEEKTRQTSVATPNRVMLHSTSRGRDGSICNKMLACWSEAGGKT